MILGTLQLELYFPDPQSLKEKRQILKSVLTRLKQKFNVSVSELDNMDKWQSSIIGVAYIGRNRNDIDRGLNSVVQFFDQEDQLQVVRQMKELL